MRGAHGRVGENETRPGAQSVRYSVIRCRYEPVAALAAVEALSNHACSGDGGRVRSGTLGLHVPASPDSFELLSPPHAIAFRPGAELAHPIFYDRFFKLIICTDELALRVLWAGCTGLRFVDPARLRDGLGPYRTLRGVEEDNVWDSAREIHFTKLIREIP